MRTDTFAVVLSLVIVLAIPAAVGGLAAAEPVATNHTTENVTHNESPTAPLNNTTTAQNESSIPPTNDTVKTPTRSDPTTAPSNSTVETAVRDQLTSTTSNATGANESSAKTQTPLLNESVMTPRGLLPISPPNTSQVRLFAPQSHETSLFVVSVTDATPSNLDTINATGAHIQYVVDRRIEVRATGSQIAAVRNLTFVTSAHRPHITTSSTAALTQSVTSMNATSLRTRGIDGSGISIGVLSVGGIDTTNPAIADQIVGVRSFSNGIANGGNSAHGTAVAELAAETAPGASLYVTNSGSSVSYQEAAQWLRAQNVDIIVMSAGFYGQPFDGTGPVSQVADRAVDDGIVWVNAAGNSANAHWQGGYRNPDGNVLVNIDGQYEANALARGQPMSAGTPIRVSLTWNDWPRATSNYDLILLRLTNSGASVVATSARLQNGYQPPAESISTRAPTRGVYAVAIAKQSDPAPSTRQLELFSAESPLTSPVARGSLAAPAVGDRVLSIGAYNADTDSLESFSSHGPTNDGQLGLDVIAPDRVLTSTIAPFPGTSAAAPNAAGAIALLLDINPSLTPHKVTSLLQTTAVDVREPGADLASGYGRLDVAAAAQTLETTIAEQYEFDARLESGTTTWTGQSLYVRDSLSSDRANVLHRVVDGAVGPAVRSVPTDENGVAILNTTGLTGRYVLTNTAGTPLVIANGTVTETATVADAAFTVTQQSLTLTSSVSNETRTLTATSNRSGYDLILAWDAVRYGTADAGATTALHTAVTNASANATAVDADGDGTVDALRLQNVSSTATLQLDERALANATYAVAAGPLGAHTNATTIFYVGAPAGTVTVSPSRDRVAPNTTTTVQIQPHSLPTTVANYSLTLRTTNPDAAEIRGFDLPANVTGTVTRTGTEAVSVSVTAPHPPLDGSFGTATLSTGRTGTATLTLTDVTVTTPAGTRYMIDTNPGTVIVTDHTAPPIVGDTPPTDPDGDGTYEDINGDGTANTVDVQALFSNLSAAEGNAAFDINGDGAVNAVDVQALFANL